ncbi:LysR family transcriptional regulator [Azotosporobacter soli]|uniref:LysR family transcriptional regulator n=1 Tax=Azotosporobacter soli TaxID=3055040 RepID=UPI0031FE7AFF
MDIRDMKVFSAIAEEGNISNAAKRLNIAQPALSRQMKQLEEELGVQLFERGSRRIRLTEAGQLFRERAAQILALADATANEMSDFHSGLGGVISLGAVTTSGVALLPNLISRFYQLYPNVTFQLWEGDGFRVLELLNTGIIEVGIIRAPFDSELYESILLPPEPLAVAMKKNACYCGKREDSVKLSELAEQPLIIPLRWKEMFLDWCAKAGFTPKIICVSDSITLNILWTKQGLGMALVPKSTEDLFSDPSLRYKIIAEPSLATQTAIVWLRNRRLSASSRHFLDLLQKDIFQ